MIAASTVLSVGCENRPSGAGPSATRVVIACLEWVGTVSHHSGFVSSVGAVRGQAKPLV